MISERIIDPILCACVFVFVIGCALYGCDVLRCIVDGVKQYRKEKDKSMDLKRINDLDYYIPPYKEMCSNEYPEKAECPHCGDITETDVEICGTCEKPIDWESYFEKDYDND